MTLVTSQVRVAGTGELFLAPVGTALPTTTAGALDEDFVGYGYTTEDGVGLTNSYEREGIPAWQSVSPIRYIINGRELAMNLSMLQANKDIVKLWLNSGDFAGTTPNFKADIPVSPVGQEFAGVLEWHDGALSYRLVVAKLEVTETGDISIARAAVPFPVTLTATPPDSGSVLASFITNDPAFDPAA